MNTPGAGTYEYDREFKDNDSPAYNIGLPLPQRPSELPLPTACTVNIMYRITQLIFCAFIMCHLYYIQVILVQYSQCT